MELLFTSSIKIGAVLRAAAISGTSRVRQIFFSGSFLFHALLDYTERARCDLFVSDQTREILHSQSYEVIQWFRVHLESDKWRNIIWYSSIVRVGNSYLSSKSARWISQVGLNVTTIDQNVIAIVNILSGWWMNRPAPPTCDPLHGMEWSRVHRS